MDNLSKDAIAALNYERSNFSNGPVKSDPFYSVPQGTAESLPGTLLKVEKDAHTSAYTLPPTTTLSRIIYQSKKLNGDLVPVSAYVLWPYSPRSQTDGYQIVAWAHGTSGLAAECAPSHLKNLWQHFLAPFQLAMQGYVVVATDYAGLGIGFDANGKKITHEYLANPAAANDVVYSVQAARQAFPQLSKSFVVIGHSQGGGATWAVAQREAVSPHSGYLGAVAASPITSNLKNADPAATLIQAAMAPGIASNFPEFELNSIFTTEGMRAFEQLMEFQGCTSFANAVLGGPLSNGNLLSSDWRSNPWVLKYDSLTKNGGQEISKPLLVIHGEKDPTVDINLTIDAISETVSKFPKSQLRFFRLPHTTHIGALTGSQRVWMDWIADRFAGKSVEPFDVKSTSFAVLARPSTTYTPGLNWFIGTATEPHQTA